MLLATLTQAPFPVKPMDGKHVRWSLCKRHTTWLFIVIRNLEVIVVWSVTIHLKSIHLKLSLTNLVSLNYGFSWIHIKSEMENDTVPCVIFSPSKIGCLQETSGPRCLCADMQWKKKTVCSFSPLSLQVTTLFTGFGLPDRSRYLACLISLNSSKIAIKGSFARTDLPLINIHEWKIMAIIV